jgi:hypothetical protein
MESGAFVLVFEMSKVTTSVTMATAGLLQIKYKFKENSELNKMREIPGAQKIHVLTGSNLEMQAGFIASKQNSRGTVFLETEEPLEDLLKDPQWRAANWQERWGSAVPISDFEKTKIQLQLKVNGQLQGTIWEPSLADLFGKKKLPPVLLQEWAEAAGKPVKNLPLWKKIIQHGGHVDLEIEGKMIMENGESHSLGAMMTGKTVKKFLGKTIVQKILAKLRLDKIGKVPLVQRVNESACEFYYRSEIQLAKDMYHY